MSHEIKFFDVECANGRAYDLKELRRVLVKVIGKRVLKIRVFRKRRSVAGEVARVVVHLDEYIDVNFHAIQREQLEHRGLLLLEVAEDGSAESLREPAISVSPTTIPVFIQLVPAVKRFPSRRLHPRTAA